MDNLTADNLKKWRLILGGEEADGIGITLDENANEIDTSLSALYEFDRKKEFNYQPTKPKGSGGKSQPSVARWLGDIRKYFPKSIVEVMQNDALKHPELQKKLVLEPEILEQSTPDVHLVATLMELGKLIPAKTKATARKVIQTVVDEMMLLLQQKTIAAISGAINKSSKNFNPKYNEIDWHSTIKKNLKHYQADYKTIIPENRIGYGRKSKKALKEIVLLIDQSGSMGTSIIYSSIFAAVMASLPFLKTKLILFDTEIADLSEKLNDPVEVLFGVQLGGGTDIQAALNYAQGVITKPEDTILLLVSDLYEGGNNQNMQNYIQEIHENGIQIICLLALNDDGSPSYDQNNARFISKFRIPVFACTPDKFPQLMSAAIQKQDINQWATENEMVLKG